jgi:hypothetical protein
VPYASGSASAAYPAAGGIFGEVTGTVSLPAGINEAASVFPAQSSLENLFTITGATGFVNVTFGALLSSVLSAQADAGGQVLQNDDIFNLDVDGTTVLSFDDQELAGPDGFAADAMNPILSGTISLDSSVAHDLFISLEYDPQAEEMPVPEPGATWLLLLLGGGFLAAVQMWIKKTPAADNRN